MTLHTATSRLAWRFGRLRQQRSLSLGLILGLCRQSYASSGRRCNAETQQGDHEPWPTCFSFLSPSSSAITSAIAASPFPQLITTKSFTKVPLLAILLTPAHLKLLNDTEGFIPNLLRRLFQEPHNGQKFDVLAAVVDRIPYSSLNPSTERGDQDSAANVLAESQVGHGIEGISCIVLDSAEATPDLWSAHDESRERETMTIQQRCTLSFVFPPAGSSTPLLLDGKERYHDLVSRTLQLPVANTVFQNGKTATLIAQRWKAEQSTKSSLVLSCIQESALPQQLLRMPKAFSSPSRSLDPILHSYLIPITPPRTVSAAVGNIIRRLFMESAQDGSAPASEELERTVSNAIRAGHIPAQQVGVWALVKDSKISVSGAQNRNGEAAEAEELQESVLDGCRLHRVLSGGGGWGEKQGLLALDPDSDYNPKPNSFEPPFNTDLESEKLQGLGQVVKAGDVVRFYINRSPSFHGLLPGLLQNQGAAETPISMSFGSLPSTADLMPGSSGTESGDSNCAIISNHFGMLSEQGMSLQSIFMGGDVVLNSLGQGLPSDESPYQIVSTTKLDAPYMTFAFKGLTQATDLPSGTNKMDSQEPLPESQGVPLLGLAATAEAMDSKNEGLIAEGSASPEDFLDAISSMPPHQYVEFMPTRGTVRGRSQAKAKDDEPFIGSPIVGKPVEGFRKITVGYPAIRKHKMEGPINKIAFIPLSQLKRVQLRISKLSGQFQDKSNANAASGPVIENTRQPRMRQVDHGPRIYKHEVKLPLLNPSLSSSVRRRVLTERQFGDDWEITAKNRAERSPESSIRNRDPEALRPSKRDQSAKENSTGVKRTNPQVRFLAEKSESSFAGGELTLAPQNVATKHPSIPPGSANPQKRGSEAVDLILRKHLKIEKLPKAHLKDKTINETRGVNRTIKTSRTQVEDLIRQDLIYSEDLEYHIPTSPSINKYMSRARAPAQAKDKA